MKARGVACLRLGTGQWCRSYSESPEEEGWVRLLDEAGRPFCWLCPTCREHYESTRKDAHV